MATFTGPEEFQEAEFRDVNLRGARFAEADLSGVVMRGVDVARIDIDAPWLPHGGFFRLNGVDVIPFVEAELDKRFPGRGERRAADPDGLRAAWAALERTWDATVEHAGALPEGTVDLSVAGEWSFAQTLRHLVHATDIWLRKAILAVDQPLHPIGQVDVASADEVDGSVFTTGVPPYSEVLAVRAERVAMVREFIAGVTPAQLDEPRPNPHEPELGETVRSCLHVILEEEWEHHRFAVRDLETLEASDGDGLGRHP